MNAENQSRRCAACDLLPVQLINLQIAPARDIINGWSIGGGPPCAVADL
jgi:hypothetical protein